MRALLLYQVTNCLMKYKLQLLKRKEKLYHNYLLIMMIVSVTMDTTARTTALILISVDIITLDMNMLLGEGVEQLLKDIPEVDNNFTVISKIGTG